MKQIFKDIKSHLGLKTDMDLIDFLGLPAPTFYRMKTGSPGFRGQSYKIIEKCLSLMNEEQIKCLLKNKHDSR